MPSGENTAQQSLFGEVIRIRGSRSPSMGRIPMSRLPPPAATEKANSLPSGDHELGIAVAVVVVMARHYPPSVPRITPNALQAHELKKRKYQKIRHVWRDVLGGSI